jgi:hypothetical protein
MSTLPKARMNLPVYKSYGFDWFDEKWNDLNPANPTATLGVKRASQLKLLAA